MASIAEELERLARLRNNGDISTAEYETLKGHVLKEAKEDSTKDVSSSGPEASPRKIRELSRGSFKGRKSEADLLRENYSDAEDLRDQILEPYEKAEATQRTKGDEPYQEPPGEGSVFERLSHLLSVAADQTGDSVALRAFEDASYVGTKFTDEEWDHLDGLKKALERRKKKRQAALEKERARERMAEGAAAAVKKLKKNPSSREDPSPKPALDLRDIPVAERPPLSPSQQAFADAEKQRMIDASDDPEATKRLLDLPPEHQAALVEAFEANLDSERNSLKARRDALIEKMNDLREQHLGTPEEQKVVLETRSTIAQYLRTPIQEIVETLESKPSKTFAGSKALFEYSGIEAQRVPGYTADIPLERFPFIGGMDLDPNVGPNTPKGFDPEPLDLKMRQKYLSDQAFRPTSTIFLMRDRYFDTFLNRYLFDLLLEPIRATAAPYYSDGPKYSTKLHRSNDQRDRVFTIMGPSGSAAVDLPGNYSRMLRLTHHLLEVVLERPPAFPDAREALDVADHLAIALILERPKGKGPTGLRANRSPTVRKLATRSSWPTLRSHINDYLAKSAEIAKYID